MSRAVAVVCALTLIGPGTTSALGPGGKARQGDLPSQVRSLLSVKCAGCHGAGLRRPKGKFGGGTNLERVAGDPKVVVAFKPEESKLWVLVNEGKMPPEDSEVAPLTREEKDLIHDWIACGAPTTASGPPPAAPAPAAPAESGTAVRPPALLFYERTLRWLGRFHILAVHFPTALLIAAALGEVWCLWRHIRGPWPPVRFCILCGAAGAVAAAVLGWLHADFGGFGSGSGALLAWHRWTGTLAACWAAAVAALSEVEARRERRTWLFRAMLATGAILVAATAHFGGTLVRGDEFLRW
jgi:hypothetical protein